MAGTAPLSPMVRAALRTDSAATLPGLATLGSDGGPAVVIVGLGSSAPKTTASMVEEGAKLGMRPGSDLIVTRYSNLRVGTQGGFVRLAEGAGQGGRVLAGQGQEALFLFRGGGNLGTRELDKIARIQSVAGATALNDLSFIQRAGSKAVTFDRLKDADVALADTIPVHGREQAVAAFDQVTSRFGTDVAVLKKVNSLGGKDVHFVRSHDDVARVVRDEPDADYVMQEFLPHAKDQDVRVHMVWDHAAKDFAIPDAYVRNRAPFRLTPNLANGGHPTGYVLSPWEREQVLTAAHALAAGSPTPPLHVGLDLFPRRPITAGVVERNNELEEAVASGAMSRSAAMAESADTAVIGEAASSAGTKGTEIVRGGADNPVTAMMMREIAHIREHGISPLVVDSTRAAATAVSRPA